MLVGNLVGNHYLENEMIVEYDSNLYLKYKSQRIEKVILMLDKFFDWVKVGRFNAFPVDIVCNVFP